MTVLARELLAPQEKGRGKRKEVVRLEMRQEDGWRATVTGTGALRFAGLNVVLGEGLVLARCF